jgi:hypothetical protein
MKTEKAILRFSFWPLGPEETIIDTLTVPIENEIVMVDFTAKNISTVHANNVVKIRIQICDECRFAEEPQGSETMQPPNNVVRRMSFAPLHAGVSYEPTKLKIIPPSGFIIFTIAFGYTCDTCPPIDNKHRQILRVNLLSDKFLEFYLMRVK